MFVVFVGVCRLKVKAGKLVESCSSLVSRKDECSKPIFQMLVYYIINCFTLVFNGFDLNHV